LCTSFSSSPALLKRLQLGVLKDELLLLLNIGIMTKPIAVISGATGGQGGSVVDSFLRDGTYQVRAVTRNVNSEKAVSLRQRGVEVVTGDLNDQSSLVEAFKAGQFTANETHLTFQEGATLIFAVTDFF
jgi:hypothetical protein